jgi:uncharacterized protein (TIGR00251 family)
MLSESRGVVRLSIHVQPGAKRSAVLGVYGDALKVAISAPPVEGKANEAVGDLIAALLGVPSRAVNVVAGHSSRRKVLSVEGVTLAEASMRVAELLKHVG